MGGREMLGRSEGREKVSVGRRRGMELEVSGGKTKT